MESSPAGGGPRPAAVERRRTAQSPSSTGGFTLIEVIAALVVFSVGVLLTTGLTTSLSIQMRNASLRSQVVTAAQQQIDSVLVQPFVALAVGTTGDTLQLQGRKYSRTLKISQIDSLGPRVREIEVLLVPLVGPAPGYRVVSFAVEPW